jgi:fatty acid synthase subunit alpha, fungi type
MAYVSNLHFGPWWLANIFLQEKDETQIWNDIFTSLARTPGNAVPVMAQKSLLGHSKGGSASWQMTGLLQTVSTGIVPGNRNYE